MRESKRWIKRSPFLLLFSRLSFHIIYLIPVVSSHLSHLLFPSQGLSPPFFPNIIIPSADIAKILYPNAGPQSHHHAPFSSSPLISSCLPSLLPPPNIALTFISPSLLNSPPSLHISPPSLLISPFSYSYPHNNSHNVNNETKPGTHIRPCIPL